MDSSFRRRSWPVFVAMLVVLWALGDAAAHGQCAGGACQDQMTDVQPTGTQNPAIVRVWTRLAGGQGSSGGSGSLIAEDDSGRGLVITNRHVVDGGRTFEVHWPSGEVSQAKLLGVGGGSDDLAALFVTVPEGIDPLELREEEPEDGETLWIAGYGGSKFSFGPGDYNTWNETNAAIEGTPARHGDSGGPIIDEQGRVAGVLWGSNFQDHTVCIRLPRVRRFLLGVGRVAKWAVGPCCGGNASTGSGSRQRFLDPPDVLGGNGDPDDLDEPGLPEPAPPPVPKPRSDAAIASVEKKLDDLTKKLGEIADRKPEPGPAGPVGPPGPAGPQGPAGKDADPELLIALNARMDLLEREVAAAQNRPATPDGGAGGVLTGTAKISHIVLLVDKSQAGWARLAAFLAPAQDHLPVHVVDYSEVPWKVRQLPQAVVYNTAHEAVSVSKGLRDVETTLAAVERGELQ